MNYVKLLKALVFILFSFIVLISLVVVLLYSIREKQTTELINPIVSNVVKRAYSIHSLFTSGIEKVVDQSLSKTDGTYSIVVRNMKTGESYSQNPDRVYESASLYKLWVMACVYQQLNSGKLKKSDTLTGTVEDLNLSFGIASTDAELTTGKISYTVGDALTNMITVSDNYSALLLAKKIGMSNIAKFLNSQGLSSSQTGNPPTTTASDIMQFYSKLYHHELINYESSEEMIALLRGQAINDRIPKYLPTGISVAHKTGELDDFKHDAGIVYTPKGDYIIVLLSQTDDPDQASEIMAELSKQIYLHFISST